MVQINLFGDLLCAECSGTICFEKTISPGEVRCACGALSQIDEDRLRLAQARRRAADSLSAE